MSELTALIGGEGLEQSSRATAPGFERLVHGQRAVLGQASEFDQEALSLDGHQHARGVGLTPLNGIDLPVPERGALVDERGALGNRTHPSDPAAGVGALAFSQSGGRSGARACRGRNGARARSARPATCRCEKSTAEPLHPASRHAPRSARASVADTGPVQREPSARHQSAARWLHKKHARRGDWLGRHVRCKRPCSGQARAEWSRRGV